MPLKFIRGAADYGMDRRPCPSVPLLCLRHVGIGAAATLALAVDLGRKPQEAVVNGVRVVRTENSRPHPAVRVVNKIEGYARSAEKSCTTPSSLPGW